MRHSKWDQYKNMSLAVHGVGGGWIQFPNTTRCVQTAVAFHGGPTGPSPEAPQVVSQKGAACR